MKPYLVYGSLIALINSVATLVLYLTGLHSDSAKLLSADYISTAISFAAGISFMVTGVRDRRTLTPPTDNFTFGMALGIAIVISLFSTILSTAFQFIYQSFINPGYADVVIQSQIAALRGRNIPAEHVEKAEAMIRTTMKPAIQAAIGLVFSTLINVGLSLIIAVVMRRKAVEEPATPAAS